MSKRQIESQREGGWGGGAWLRRNRAVRIAFATALLFVLILSVELTAGSASARDDVPEQIAGRENPVSLEETEPRYYKHQFKGKCARCHAKDGTGASEPPAPHSEPAANFTDARYMATRSDGQRFYQILMGGGERCAMPAFGPESDHAWNEEKIWHMVAYARRFAIGSAP